MSYQVLARKWRPRSFAEMVGQEHVLRALINALDNDRVHHAFLFTGTRGVGKTTIARILAKSLNCEQGVSSTPCGECSACREIDEGRFIDLIEVDAASRTKVEDTRELLENVQYAPTRGRYKVYLIDEVHMLSNHSFNALLKTLEEPPPHVKFLLATTDPQKLPVTILSRCLQFSLKRLPLPQITGYLEHLLCEEEIDGDPAALQHLARAADGSMRDALSLLDQAIAFGDGTVHEAEVSTMLGSVSRDHVMCLLNGLARRDAAGLLASVAEVAEQSPDFDGLLAEIIITLHRIALAQFSPEAIDDNMVDRDDILELAGCIPPEDIQLYYQIGLLGRRDLPLAPDARGGFEMVLLRMLCFIPQPMQEQAQAVLPPRSTSRASTTKASTTKAPTTKAPTTKASTTKAPTTKASTTTVSANPASSAQAPAGKDSDHGLVTGNPPVRTRASVKAAPVTRGGRAKAAAEAAGLVTTANTVSRNRTTRTDHKPASTPITAPLEEPEPAALAARKVSAEAIPAPPPQSDVNVENKDNAKECSLAPKMSWEQLLPQLNLAGVTLQLASNCAMVRCDDRQVELMLDPAAGNLLNPKTRQRLTDAWNTYAGSSIKLTLRIGRVEQETPQQQQVRLSQKARQAAVEALEKDANIQAMKETFNAQLRMDSVQVLDN